MKTILRFILPLVFLLSCESASRPEGIIDQEPFVEVLQDIFLLDSAFRQKVILEDYPNQKLPAYYDQVFTKHAINRTAFDSSYNYYSRHPKMMTEILTSVKDRLAMEEVKYKDAEGQVLE